MNNNKRTEYFDNKEENIKKTTNEKFDTNEKFGGWTDSVDVSEQDMYFVPPHRRRKMRSDDNRDHRTAKILAGSGPLAMIMITILDFMIDSVIEVGMTLSKIAIDGFDYVYSGMLGNFQGIFPGYGGYTEYKESGKTYVEIHGTCFSYTFLRYILTLITPPVGVFMGKGIKGWFSILICVLICYINYFVGVLYAFIITSRNRYADRYGKREEERRGLDKERREKENKKDIKYIIGFGVMVGLIILICWFMMKNA